MPYKELKKGNSIYLAGDIGGTKTLLGLYSQKEDTLRLLKEVNLASKDWQYLTPLVLSFLTESHLNPENITAGCLSLAGPIYQDNCHLTNLNRTIYLKHVQSALNFQKPLLFINDVEAMGHGLTALTPGDLLCLTHFSTTHNKPGTPINRAIIAPGTGLGEAMVMKDNQVYPTEAAHADFAPRTEEEVSLWRFLASEFGHVSYERVLSGPGLENIYRFLLRESRQDDRDIPTPSEITKKALSGICPLCTDTVELFIKILGAEAGNLALRTLAYGGVYLAGGIPPKILPKLRNGSFMEAFLSKGRSSDLLVEIPIYVVLDEKISLHGAAKFASAALETAT